VERRATRRERVFSPSRAEPRPEIATGLPLALADGAEREQAQPTNVEALLERRSSRLAPAARPSVRRSGLSAALRGVTRLWLVLALGAAVGATALGCKKPSDDGTTPVSGSLPPLTLRDDTPDLLLTWIDERGDFHTTQAIGDVPAHGRDAVRVVITSKDDGSVTDQVYVANLMDKKPDGSYAVQSMSRAAWDAQAAKHRAPVPGDAPPGSAAPVPGEVRPSGTVIIYGASWCGPCHQAQKYLEAKHVKVIYKDIEADPQADGEMQKKLAAAGKRGGTIPVIDVGGRLLVGFRPSSLDEAVAQMATKGTEL
jgi:glutaredoxin